MLTSREVSNLLSSEVLVEEKLDGANLGISIGPDGNLHVQNRGQYLIESFAGQFSRLTSWIGHHQLALRAQLPRDCILFGEWCAARHTLDYESLPDWFVVFDLYDRTAKKFWSSERRNTLVASLGLSVVPNLYRGKLTPKELMGLLDNNTSRYRSGPPEGIVIRQQSPNWCDARAKLVQAEFIQTINEHWRSRSIEWNRVQSHSAGYE